MSQRIMIHLVNSLLKSTTKSIRFMPVDAIQPVFTIQIHKWEHQKNIQNPFSGVSINKPALL